VSRSSPIGRDVDSEVPRVGPEIGTPRESHLISRVGPNSQLNQQAIYFLETWKSASLINIISKVIFLSVIKKQMSVAKVGTVPPSIVLLSHPCVHID
jgi:hypothetical protein